MQPGGGGAEGIRTPDLLIANETLYQLSYGPVSPEWRAHGWQRRDLKASVRSRGSAGRVLRPPAGLSPVPDFSGNTRWCGVIGIIFNPAARGEKAIRFREHLADLGPDVRVVPTRHAGDARVLAQTLVADGHDCPVAAGGDGTGNEVPMGFVITRTGCPGPASE